MADVANRPVVGAANDLAVPTVNTIQKDLDACDLVDDFPVTKSKDNAPSTSSPDQDFSAFADTAKTLEPETIAQANKAAVEATTGVSGAFADETAKATVIRANKEVVQNSNPEAARSGGFADESAIAEVLNKSFEKKVTDDSHDSGFHGLVDDHGNPISEAASANPNKRFVTPRDFELMKVIGMGAFGKVLQVRNKQTKQVLAMKVISKRLLNKKQGYIENVQAERNILTRVKHPFVVCMHCSFQTKEKLFIVMDFLAGGELFLRMGREGIFLEHQAAFYLAEIILGLDHLHSKGILHRDVKPENILLGSDGHVCLTDFGLAKDFGPDWTDGDEAEKARTICGTQIYMAPEMVAQKGYSKAADYWSVGIIAYEMLNGLPPFNEKDGAKELFRKIMTQKIKMPPGATAAACKLLKGLLNRDVQNRWGASKNTMFVVGGVAQLKSSDFFHKIDWEKLERKELKPPYDLSVESETDLKNFHNEFTDMPLPRSVIHMSTKNAVARCESGVFRGFSFVQNEFVLPDRSPGDVDQYWNGDPEEDGESLSETASSKMGAEQPLQAEPKKKRPPRKRKKKKNATDSASQTGSVDTVDVPLPEDKPTTNASADGVTKTSHDDSAGLKSPAAVINESSPHVSAVSQTRDWTGNMPSTDRETEKKVASKRPGTDGSLDNAWATADPIAMNSTQHVEPQTSAARQVGGYAWTPVGQAANKAIQPDKPNHRLPTQAGTWTTQKKQPVATATHQVVSAPVGSWAAKIHQKSVPQTVKSGPASVQQANTTPSRRNPTLQASTDWRSHSSPVVRKAIRSSVMRSPPHVGQSATQSVSAAGGAPEWPTLSSGGASSKPSKPGDVLKKTSNAPVTGLKGAWASRAKP